MGVKRINITLPEDVVDILEKSAKNGEKSSYIAKAVRAYSKTQSKRMLIREMIEGYQATAHEDLEEADFWNDTLPDGLEDKS
jgi:metal-responsive CopG/Arc/MetJ family transcriptional regulator